MFIKDEETGQVYDVDKVKAIIAYFLAMYAPDDWREILAEDKN